MIYHYTMEEIKPTTANGVWIATALLHKENPDRQSFQTQEIIQKVKDLGLLNATEATLSVHVSHHCVASSKASPDTHRKLTRVQNGWYRLFKPGDSFHPSRERGRIEPLTEMVPTEHRHLLDWFKNEYCKNEEITNSSEILTEAMFARVEQNSVELPNEVVSALELQEGDFVGFMIRGKEVLLKKAKMRLEV